MINPEQRDGYRRDIDGLRAIAVLAIIAFHFGYLPNGYLGVDIFFVISGFLITGILYRQISDNRFSIANFYLRRIRRIIPLLLVVGLVSLALGMAVMLPDDLENLAQSVLATNLSSNNILQVLTTKNYWDIFNEYKPLMHTWSLGIEEQYYLLYPLLFVALGSRKPEWILPALVGLTLISLLLFFAPVRGYLKFYLLPFRFFELSLGGIAAILTIKGLVQHRFPSTAIFLLLVVLVFGISKAPNSVLLVSTVLLTCAIVISVNGKSKTSALILENGLMVRIGMLSFSLYMWHQVVLAFGRYTLFSELTPSVLVVVSATIIVLSIATYYFVEQPFRNKDRVSNRNLFVILGALFLATSAIALYVYDNAGVIRDVPELGLTRGQVERQQHAAYNARVFDYDNDFNSTDKTKILVVGDSFARDWANVLLESEHRADIELSYLDSIRSVEDANGHTGLAERAAQADIVFFSRVRRETIEQLGIDEENAWGVGTKSFGVNNGLVYNYRGDDYYQQRVAIGEPYLTYNESLKNSWGERYIDLIGKVIDEDRFMPVFTPDRQFISQDTRHLTEAGARYYSRLFARELDQMMEGAGGESDPDDS